MNTLSINIPDSVPAEEARRELAVALYRSAKVTQGEAAEIAALSRQAFIQLLLSRGEPVSNISVEDLREELAAWRSLESRTAPH